MLVSSLLASNLFVVVASLNADVIDSILSRITSDDSLLEGCNLLIKSTNATAAAFTGNLLLWRGPIPVPEGRGGGI